MKKINLLEFSNQWSMGGTEKAAQLFMKYIDKDKFNVYAAGWRGGPRESLVRDLGVEMHIEENQNNMIEWIKSKNIDIVHMHRAGSEEHILIDTFKKAGVKCIVEHNIFAQVDNSSDENEIDKHIFLSNIQLEMYKQRAGSPRLDKLEALYYPVETEAFIKKENYSAPIFGRHSRPDMYKWSLVNIQILPIIKAEIPDAKFHVIGLPDQYREAIKRIGCEDMVVEFPATSDQNEIAKFLNGLTIYTHGAMIGESFGMVIAEAMSTGLPVITHRGGDGAQAELVVDGVNGIVCQENNFKEYAAALIYLLKNRETEAVRMGSKGIEFSNKFAAEAITRKLEKILVDTFNNKTGSSYN